MFKEIGRLDAFELKQLEDYIQELFTHLDNGSKDRAIEMLEEVCRTNNYYLRETVGKLLTGYSDQDKITSIADDMMASKTYGVRAAGFFYFYNKYIDNHDKLAVLLEENYDSVPWEIESIVNELWKKNPKLTKVIAPKWYNSENEKKRIIAFHGMELIAESDTMFVLDFLTQAIDDDSIEIQKKITHIILQIVKSKPAETYAYLREWIMTGPDKRVRIILNILRKIIAAYSQKNQRDKPADFVILTKQILFDWKSEPNRKVAVIGQKLNQIIKKENHSFH